jgi:hypothetical protein
LIEFLTDKRQAVIFYLVTEAYALPMRNYLNTWGQALARTVTIVPYEDLFRMAKLPAGTYIFSDLDRLTPAQRATASEVCDQLSTSGSATVLNSPLHTLRRYDLLRVLHEKGVNKFGVHRLAKTRSVERFPVFLREESGHRASLTPLLSTQDELDKAIVRTLVQGHNPRDLLIVEFCDTSAGSGLFRKYAAFIVGERVIPRHILIGRNWILKYPEEVDEQQIEEEKQFLNHNPHEPALRAIFKTARVDYGRVDYGLLDGTPQVWEVNTNPVVLMLPHIYAANRIPAQEIFAERVLSAFEALDTPSAGAMIPIEIPPRAGLMASRARGKSEAFIKSRPALLTAVRRARRWLSVGGRPAVVALERVAVSLRRPILWLLDRFLRTGSDAR